MRDKINKWFNYAEGPVGKFGNWLIVILIIVSFAILPFEMFQDYSKYDKIIYIISRVIIGFFILEYILRIYSASNRLKYIFSLHGVIDLFAIVPFFITGMNFAFIRVLILGNVVRVLRYADIIKYRRFHKGLRLIEGEEIKHYANKHPVVFIVNLFPILFFLILGFSIDKILMNQYSFGFLIMCFILAFLFLIKAWLNYVHDIIIITNERIIILSKNLFSVESHEIFFNDICDVQSFHPHFMAYFLGYGSLTLQTNSGRNEIKISQIIDHENLRYYIDTHKANK